MKRKHLPCLLRGLFLLALASAPAFGCLDDSAYWSSAETDGTTSIDWADWDQDGDLDLAVGNGGDPGAANRVYQNNGGALTLVWTSAELDNTTSVDWGDWNNDGYPELAVGNMADAGAPNRVYRNIPSGPGRTLELAWTSTELGTTAAVAWGDYTGDGLLDLAVGNAGTTSAPGDANLLYKNTGGALALDATYNDTYQDPTTSLAWGDYDKDGDQDLAVGNIGYPQGRTRILRNNGGAFTLAQILSGTSITMGVSWGDYDKDGDIDLGVSNLGNTQAYRNNGTNFTLQWTSTSPDSGSDVAWGDWNNDGYLELAVAIAEEGSRVYEFKTGTFLLAWESMETFTASTVAWADFNKDGYLDLAISNVGAPVNLYINKCGFPVVSDFDGAPTSGAPPLDVQFTDSSKGATGYQWTFGDGSPASTQKNPLHTYTDLGVFSVIHAVTGPGGSDSKTRRNYVNVSLGCLDIASTWSSGERNFNAGLAWADIEGDGDLDLSAGNPLAGIDVYRNQGGALDLVWTSEEKENTTSIAWADWDQDGDLDLAVGNGGNPAQANRLYEFQGGVFTSAWTSTEIDNTRSVAWGNLNKDAFPDLAVGNGGDVGQPNRVYRNSSGAGFTLVWTSPQSDSTTSVAWMDVDGDGDDDIIAGNTGTTGAPNRLYKNNGGTGNPWNFSLFWSSAESDMTTSLSVADYDGDGDPDLAAGNTGSPTGHNRVYRNDGGSLVLAWTCPEAYATTSIGWGDWDDDGDPDLAFGNINNDFVRVYANDGGSFSLAWSSFHADSVYSLAWGDLEGNGGQELAVGTTLFQPIRVYHNNCPDQFFSFLPCVMKQP